MKNSALDSQTRPGQAVTQITLIQCGRKSLQTELELKWMGELGLVLNHSESTGLTTAKTSLPLLLALTLERWFTATKNSHTSLPLLQASLLQHRTGCFAIFLMLGAKQKRAPCVTWRKPRFREAKHSVSSLALPLTYYITRAEGFHHLQPWFSHS